MNHNTSKQKYRQIRDFSLFFLIIGCILLMTLILQLIRGWNLHHAMTDFMGIFFLVFGSFKLINLSGFVMAFQMYDIIAQHSKMYATIYPFIEILLGIGYLARVWLFQLNLLTLTLMIIGTIGVLKALSKKEEFQCACLGTIINLPLTYISLAEDLVMGLMALLMLLNWL